jgi:hypothetical protein
MENTTLPFIQSIKRFKSVELYIASLEPKALVQSGYIDSSADTGSEQTLKPEEVAGSGKPSDKTQLLPLLFRYNNSQVDMSIISRLF